MDGRLRNAFNKSPVKCCKCNKEGRWAIGVPTATYRLEGDVMMWAQRFWLRLQTLFRRDRSTQRLDDEIQFHLDQQIAENIAGGMSREEARYAAMRTFGNPTFLQEETRDTWGLDLARANCSRHSPRFAAARAKSGLYARGCPLAGFGNRRKHCDLQLHRRLGDQAAALPACGPTRGLRIA